MSFKIFIKGILAQASQPLQQLPHCLHPAEPVRIRILKPRSYTRIKLDIRAEQPDDSPIHVVARAAVPKGHSLRS